MKLSNLTEAHRSENDDIALAPQPGELGVFISTAQAARILGVTMPRVRQLILNGTLKSYAPEKGRRDHILRLSDVEGLKSAKEKRQADASRRDKKR